MSLSSPSIVDRTKNWIRLLKRRPRSPSIHHDGKAGAEFFSNARDFTLNDAQIINELKINYINNIVSSRQAVFELLEPYTCLDATKDSSARHPPPRCHPETRLRIRERLMRWLLGEDDEWKMLWVRGSAGTGKSAVAQSFADSCEEEEILGGSYFFSRTAGRNRLETVVPTLVYQLARSIPAYHSIIERQLAGDRLLLRNSPPVQFRKLIIEPFSILQRHHRFKPIVIILDGLDECEGENAQREILEMITNAIRTNPDLPLRWLIFSRPEAHLKNAFSRNSECGREELIIDDECRENVERFVKDRVIEIKMAYNHVTPVDWPSQEKLQELLDAVSGLFVFASTCLNFIGSPEEADPRSQLDSLLAFIRRSQGFVSRNPLAALDLLYSRILDNIPPTVFKTTWQILAYMSHRITFDKYKELGSAQALSNFLRLDQHAFYKSTRGLHSVMGIPEVEDAAESQIQFHHASFQDFLLDSNRSGKYVISEQDALVGIVPLWLYWADVDVTSFHIHDGSEFDADHKHGNLPGLTWASEDQQQRLSQSIIAFLKFSFIGVVDRVMEWDKMDESLLSLVSDIDFRYWLAEYVHDAPLLCRLDTSTPLVRVEPSSPVDHKLLEYFNLVIGNGIAKPAKFPLRGYLPDNEWIREYFIIGHGVKSVIVWRTKSFASSKNETFSLRCDEKPSEAQISKYQEFLREIEWDEAKAKSEMK